MEYLLVTEIKKMEGTGEVEDRCGQEFLNWPTKSGISFTLAIALKD